MPECVYTLTPKTMPQAMKQLAADMASPDKAPYVILQKDAKCISSGIAIQDDGLRALFRILVAGTFILHPSSFILVGRESPLLGNAAQERRKSPRSVACTDLESWDYPGFVPPKARSS